eukprot:TRINITY_DN3645_c0_g5_i2.p1 TRINITY_DN3645_c0_g5~~TRINITY_DN3645_c0_g5_i2.p1  ORF type:complete len:137 (-),score=28.27 TRINITY_DN3645_c0_g5_i2:121-531(-)
MAQFEALKTKQSYGYIIYRISDDKKRVIVDEACPDRVSAETSTDDLVSAFSGFIKKLPANDCRYVVYDFFYDVAGRKTQKLIFINWAAENAPTKTKMPHAATKEAFKRALNITLEVQAVDASEIDYNSVRDRLPKE